jgi:hypothetical protein
MNDARPVVVYGAGGFSARLIIEFLREYNVAFTAAGRNRAKIEEVLAHVPGIGTADYEVVEVAHDVDALAALLEGATVVCGRRGALGAARARGVGREVRRRRVAARACHCVYVGRRGGLRADRDGTQRVDHDGNLALERLRVADVATTGDAPGVVGPVFGPPAASPMDR